METIQKKPLLPTDQEIEKMAKEHILYNDTKRAWFIEGAKHLRNILEKKLEENKDEPTPSKQTIQSLKENGYNFQYPITISNVIEFIYKTKKIQISLYQPNITGYWAHNLENKAKYDSREEALEDAIARILN